MQIIRKITIYKSPVKLKEPFIISLGPLYYAENVVVVIQTYEGLTGFGECSPFKTIHGESMESCTVVGEYLSGHLIGKDALQIAELVELMDKLIYGNSCIKSAFDMALYDIASQDAGMPLYRYLGGTASKKIITDYTVSYNDAAKMAEDAVKIVANGFSIVKVKLGGSHTDDVMRMKMIREAIGYDIPLRIDANQGWRANETIAILNDLKEFNIQHCEEPISRNEFMQLPQIRASSPIPIMADESCYSVHDAKRLIELGACDLFNIKLSKTGGIYHALKIIKLAEAAGIKMQMGGFLESRLGFTAAAHFSLVSDNIIYFDFDTPLMFEEDPVEGGITYHSGGVVVLPESDGIGARVVNFKL